MVAQSIMKEIKTLIDKTEYYTAWRLIKSLPDKMRTSVIDEVLSKMEEGIL